MKLGIEEVYLDHDDLLNQGEHDHHPRGTFFKVIVNSQSISAGSAYELRTSLGREGHKTMWGMLRGVDRVGGQGYEGCFFLASDVEDESIGMSCTYAGSSYAYMGAFSRLHGDSYLSPAAMFGSFIRLRDAWIDGDEAVLEFYNSAGTAQNLTVYGTVAVK